MAMNCSKRATRSARRRGNPEDAEDILTTNIENTRESRIPAERPTLSTINSTRLQTNAKLRISNVPLDLSLDSREDTHPLQLMSVPTAMLSRIPNLLRRAAPAHPRNFPMKATTQRRIVYPQALKDERKARSASEVDRGEVRRKKN